MKKIINSLYFTDKKFAKKVDTIFPDKKVNTFFPDKKVDTFFPDKKIE